LNTGSVGLRGARASSEVRGACMELRVGRCDVRENIRPRVSIAAVRVSVVAVAVAAVVIAAAGSSGGGGSSGSGGSGGGG
jgi:hypothetical protein